MNSSSQIKKLSFIALTTAALVSFNSTYAQAADATVNFAGQVTANTCALNMKDTGNATTSTGVRSVSLGSSTSSATTAGTLFGSQTTVTLGLQASAASSAACTLIGLVNWNVAFDLQASQINTSIANKPYLINTASSGAATGVGVALFDNAGTQIATLLTGLGLNGTKVSSTSATAGSTLSFRAQLMTTTSTAPTAGQVTASIPLLIVYN